MAITPPYKGGINIGNAIDDIVACGEARGIIKCYQEFGASKESAFDKIIKACSISEDTAKEYIQKYWI